MDGKIFSLSGGLRSLERYTGCYTLETSGGAVSRHVFSGVPLLAFLEAQGLPEDAAGDVAVTALSRDGYRISFPLEALRRAKRPYLIADTCEGLPLLGPAPGEPVYRTFTPEEGYDAQAENTGGPYRLVVDRGEGRHNAPDCGKWLEAIAIGDIGAYTSAGAAADPAPEEPVPQGGDWRHGAAFPEFSLAVQGSACAGEVRLSLWELEGGAYPRLRGYFAAASGRNVWEGIPLRALIARHLRPGLDWPARISIRSGDGYQKELDTALVRTGVSSGYQPGLHREVLLAYARDGVPLQSGEAGGPLRLVVENTISAWVKDVREILLD